MANNEKKQESILVKVYILVLFLCGVGLWFAMNNAGVTKQKLAIDVELEQKLVDALVASGVTQSDVISQYARERETTTKTWNEFYKKVQLRGNKRSENFEDSFRAIARAMKLGLSKTDNVDGTVTYKFYSAGANYSNITFINPKKPVSASLPPPSKNVQTNNKKNSNDKPKPAAAQASKPEVSASSSSADVSSSSSPKAAASTPSSNVKNTKKKNAGTKAKK